MKRSLLVLLLLATIPSLSQDFVITNKGDSLVGPVKFLTYDLLDRVQVVTDKKVLLTGLQVKSVRLNDEMYKAARLGNAIQFMRVIKSGYLSLYGFRIENQTSYDGRLLVKLDGSSIEVPNLGFKKILSGFLEDCSLVADKIKNGELGRKDLEGIIDAYNSCLGKKTKETLKQATIMETSKDKLSAISALRNKIEKANEPKSKDALDLLTDIENKISRGESIPNYQMEALKSILANATEVKPELENLLALLGK